MALLEIKQVTKRFGDFTAVDRVSLAIQAGEFFTLLGPSGCGKTTLLRMIAGFDSLDEGEILLDGKDLAVIAPEKRPVHTVFQSYALFPHLNVAANIAFPLKMAKMRETEIQNKVKEVLEDVRLPGMERRFPHELSGGQRQRVAIARALVNRPRLLLLDEPLAALDLKLREQMQIELINLQKEVGITFIYVTHDQGEALALSHRIAVMNKGRIAQLGKPSEIYEFPENRFVAEFIGTCNLLNAQVDSASPEKILVNVAGLGPLAAVTHQSVQVGQSGAIALRPEKIRMDNQIVVAPDENHVQGIVHDHLYLGDVTVYRVEVPGGTQIGALLPNSGPRGAKLFNIGDRVELAWRFDAGHFLND